MESQLVRSLAGTLQYGKDADFDELSKQMQWRDAVRRGSRSNEMRRMKCLLKIPAQHCVLLMAIVPGIALRAQVERSVTVMAASRDGSTLVVGIQDDNVKGATRSHLVVAVRPSSGSVVWRYEPPEPPRTLALSPSGELVAVGLWGQNSAGEGLFLLRAASGQQVAALPYDEKTGVDPGAVYPRWGEGMEQVAFSPDGTLLYGLTNDTLFAWDIATKRYLWARDVPAVIEAPPEMPDPLPYGHATGFALSPDGRQIAAERDALRIVTAGRTRPGHFIERSAAENMQIASAAFSADSRTLAAGEFGFVGKTVIYATTLWIGGALRPVQIEGCGDEIAWTSDPSVFGCQNDSGAHLRNIKDPQTNIGSAAPSGDLPILKVGNSLWSSAYKRSDWKDPTKPLTLTLVELGTGKRVTFNLPGRPQAVGANR
jgi:hypothetical protein